MRVATVLLVWVVGLVPALVRADLKVGAYAPDLEAKAWLNTDGKTLSLTELRGMVVGLFFFGPDNGKEAMPVMTRINGSVEGQTAGVYAVGLADADQKAMEEAVKKEKFSLPLGVEARKSFDDFDIKSGPRLVLLDPAGKVAWVGWPNEKGDKGIDRIVDQLGKVLTDTPPKRTHPELVAKVEAYLKESRLALRGERIREAYEAADKADGTALRGDPLKKRCQDMLDLIEALGRDRLASADRAVEQQKYDEAVALLLELRREFQGIEASSVARRKIESLRKKNADIAKIFEQQESGGRAETILAAALDDVRDRRFGVAYEKLEEIVSEYGATETAKKAQTVLDRMKKNDALMVHVRDHKAAAPCRTLLFEARSFQNAGQTQKARELLREIIEKYPDTTFAEEARRRLAQLP
jgi:tetratricopeptide (TPR) repeat protein